MTFFFQACPSISSGGWLASGSSIFLWRTTVTGPADSSRPSWLRARACLEPWERFPQLGIEPVRYQDGMFYISGPTWTEQSFRY